MTRSAEKIETHINNLEYHKVLLFLHSAQKSPIKRSLDEFKISYVDFVMLDTQGSGGQS
ncbi:hypothetical protein ATC1_1320 [Flexilinea flocculi]|jgi:hypothetical protein|uniref:Uncharacterized protein n=1 Tax=Flexilinea flocculi TaxID=1678840 RepID=A0A0S7BTF6_9CHLR|nr:hypothetical protein ATC1_1320 [Flexilinea flocculi]